MQKKSATHESSSQCDCVCLCLSVYTNEADQSSDSTNLLIIQASD